jgi:cellulose synthase/poly-beta-1,6-N-acetylglucosamine synthase-like glycosyltransferase
MVVNGAVAGLVWLFLIYFVLLNAGYLALHLLALRTLRRRVTLRPLENLPPVHRALVPPVTVIVSVRDAVATAVERVQAALALDYPELEVVVVNDGSRDATLQALVDALALEGFPEVYWRRIPVKPVRTIYHSRKHANLRVVDKERGGTADAFNAGINASRYPLVIALDPRWALRRDALREMVEPLVDDPATLAVASTVRIEHEAGGPDTELVELPASLLARLQVIEALREPLFGRLGWARLNAALIVSGCAVLLRKDAVVDAGGFRTDMLEEQMELVARMHRLARQKGERYEVDVVPDPVCWMPAARSLSELRAPRMRWQVALAQSLAGNRAILRQPPGGALRWLAYPFMGFFERWGPGVEVFAYAMMTAMFALGLVPGMVFAGFVALVFALGFLVSMSALLLEEISFRLYPRWGQAARLAIAAVVENLGYRQLAAFWRLDALLRWWQAK